jgi:hypothetical protein
VAVASSPPREYRMRGRVHVRGGTAGYYREGSHDLCDPRQTGQLADAAVAAMNAAADALRRDGADVSWIMVSENLAGDERAIAVELTNAPPGLRAVAERAAAVPGITGCSLRAGRPPGAEFPRFAIRSPRLRKAGPPRGCCSGGRSPSSRPTGFCFRRSSLP